MTTKKQFRIEHVSDLTILTPLPEMGMSSDAWSQAALTSAIGGDDWSDLLVDLHNLDGFGAGALGFFLTLRRAVRNRNGQMALCCVPEFGLEVLKATSLDRLWQIYPSRLEAIEALKAGRSQVA